MRANPFGRVPVIFLILMGVIVGVFGALFVKDLIDQRRETADRGAMVANMMGLNAPRSANALDSRYTDTDGDLVPDVPTDPTKLIDPPTLYFSYVGVEDPTEFKGAFVDLMARLSRAAGRPVQYLPVTSTEEQLRALRDGRLHVTGLSTGAVPVGVTLGGFVPVSTFGDDKGPSDYQLLLIVNRKSTIQSLTDLAGKELTLTEPNSLSGFRAPLVLLQSIGLQAGRDFQVRYSGGHSQSIRGIKDGLFECAAVTSDLLQREQATGAIASTDFRTIYTSTESYPTAAFGLAHNLKPELAGKLREALSEMDLKGTSLEATFAREGKTRLIKADFKSDWNHVREIDSSLGVKYSIPPEDQASDDTADGEKSRVPSTQP